MKNDKANWRKMKFKEWLLSESSEQVVLMKAVHAQGAESINKNGLQLQPRHQSAINYYKKYGDVTTEQLYGPGLYFGIIPPGQDPKEFAKNNCKDYAETWGDHIILATIKKGSRGLITGFLSNHPIWKYVASKEIYIYDQLEALGVKNLLGYTKSNTHNDNEWGYKLHDKIDFWAHQHNTRQHVVIYNPSILKIIDQFKCETGNENKIEVKPLAISKTNQSDELDLEDL